MGVDVYVMARKKISREEQSIIEAYNALCEQRLDVSTDHKAYIEKILGHAPENGWYEPIRLDYNGLIEHWVDGEGGVMYGDGMVLQLDNLPPGTVALRIYAG